MPRRAALPMVLTFARVLAVPVMVYVLLVGMYAHAFWVFVAAGLSDALDGILAKRLNAASRLGAFLDPIADKGLMVAVYVTLGHTGAIPLWLVILVVFRDVLIVLGAAVYHALTHSLTMEPLPISKLNTGAQIVFAGLVLAQLGPGIGVPVVTETMLYVVAATTVASGAAYVWGWSRRVLAHEHEEAG
ncbi:cardiolipin synthase [Limimonas halophila]|uniref:CDP-diacylglycerol--glycerol-3-phosphate 3-phosphatidyltransferase n=1 Tax=Limimonas halophila TaxID=1082479 RepID=A0A1G7P8S0_9PROT|nr:CDP-alcohol phosphatidyltransferase family protein [Limimonas halophila]SDF82537.1 cardiolipin synthase [Limimonas halophila]